MRVIIAGSRRIQQRRYVDEAMAHAWFEVSQVISGAAPGVDRIGETWARSRRIPVVQVFAEWGRMGARAGLVRNLDMSRMADALVAVWDGHSTGTRHMICTMLELQKPVAAFIVAHDARLLKII